MSSGERAALLATPSRGDGGAFAPTTTERDVEVAASNGVGASSPRSSAWRRRSYLWLTIASTATFAIIMTIVAYGVSPSTAVADGGLTTAAAGTRATLGGRARGVEEDAYEDDAALGARERRRRRQKGRREDAFARAHDERHGREGDDVPTRKERLARAREAEDADDAVLSAREARRQKRVAARAEARVDSVREDAAEEASSLSRAPVSAGVAEAREARRERRRETREASRVAEQRKEAKEATVATSTESDGLTPRSVRRERRRAERIAKRMVDTRMDAAAADDRKDARSKRNDDASERQEKRERKDDAKREESERKQKRKHAEREKAEKEIEKRQDRREERKKDDKSDDAEKRQKEREKERKKDDKSDDDAEKRQKEREEMREEIQRKVESKKREIEERQEGREKDCKGDEKDSDDDAEKRQEEREEKREKLQEKREEIQRKAESKKREIEERQEEREKDRKGDEKDSDDDAEKRQEEREKERKKDDKSDADAEKRQEEREEKREKLQEKREEIQRKAESKKREIEKRQEGREKDRKGDEKDSDDDAEKRQKEREKKRAAGERDAEDKKEEIEKAKKERDHQLDTLERRSEAKKREIEQLKEEARNIHKHDSESADLGEAIKEAVFFTYSDHITGGMCASGETAAMNDIDLQILGARGAKDPFAYPDVKNVKTKKVFAFLHALTNEVWRKKFGIGDDTIVSVGDATDVLYFKHRSEVIRAFEDIETESKVADNKLVVVSSERNCWPWMIHGKERLPNGTAICASFPDAPSSYKYLNSGSLMGRAKGLAELLRDIVDRMQSVNEDDQMILANAFLRQSTSKTSSDTPYVIALDYMQRLFQTAYDGQLESRNFAQYRAKDAYYDRAHTQVVNTETHTTPVIVHFNGLKANLFPITRHFLVHHGHAEHYAQIKQSWLQTNPFFNASCQHIVDNIKIGIMPPMQKPTHTITPDVERKRLEEER